MSPLSLFPHKHQAVGLKNKHDFPINANLHPRISLTKHGAYTPSHNWWKSNSLGSVGWLSFGLGVLSRRWRTADLLFLVFSLNCLHLSLSFSLSLTFRLLVKASRTLLTGVVDDDKTMEMVSSSPSGLCGPEGEVWFNLEIEEFFVCCFKGDLGGVPVSLWNNQTEGEDPVCNRKFKVYKTFTIKPFFILCNVFLHLRCTCLILNNFIVKILPTLQTLFFWKTFDDFIAKILQLPSLKFHDFTFCDFHCESAATFTFSEVSPLDSTLLHLLSPSVEELKLPRCSSPLNSARESTESTEILLLTKAAEEMTINHVDQYISDSPLSTCEKLTWQLFLLLRWRQVL